MLHTYTKTLLQIRYAQTIQFSLHKRSCENCDLCRLGLIKQYYINRFLVLRRLTTLSFCRSVLLPYKPHRSTAVFYSNLQYACNYLAEYCNAESAAKFRKMCLIIAARTCPTAVASCDRPRFLFSSTELS